MLIRTISTGKALVPGSLTFDEAGNALWAATPGGAVVTVRLLDERVHELGSGYIDPVAALPLVDGLSLLVVEADGTLLLARRDAADRAQARQLAVLSGGALAARLHPDPGRAVVLSVGSAGGDPELVICELDPGTLTAVVSGLAGATTLSVDDGLRQATVLSIQPDGSRSLTVVGLDDGSVTELPASAAYDHLTTSPDAAVPGVLASAADGPSPGRLALVRDDGTESTSEDLAAAVDGLTRWRSLVLAAAGEDVIAVEWGIEEGTLPLAAPLGPLYVSGYARLVSDPSAAGLGIGDVAYTVREGIDAGSISAGVEPPNAAGSESVMLLAGVRPGEYHVDATRVADGSLLATRRFRVTGLWPDDDIGPPIAVTGDHKSYLMSWGGSGGSAGYLHPAPPLWRVLVVLVNMKDRGWGGLDGAAKNEWKDRVVGPNESVKRFYEEVSAFEPGLHGMTVELVDNQVFGPIAVDAGWGDVFKPKTLGDVNAGWLTKPTGYAVLAGAISDFFADLPNGAQLMQLADTISIVVRSGSDKPTDMGPIVPPVATRYVWGHASETDFYRKTATTYTQGKKPVTVMTEQYPTGAPQKNRTFTLCHEIGHNLGLADLYDADGDFPAEINARRPSGVDLMSTSGDLPHFSIANRIRLGWFDRAWLRRFDFSASPVGGSVALQATETISRVGPTGGRSAGIEVPIMNDWSYLFEYRNEQPDQIGDQNLDDVVTGRTQIVVGTDLRTRGGDVLRPPILLLGNDVDGDGPLLVNDGQNYRDDDTSNPERMHDFAMTLTQIASPDADSARVDVTYVNAHRPQLQIRPAPGKPDFKSPDIQLIGPFGPGVSGVLKGMTNVISITVHNLGSLAATDVQIHVKWLPFTVAPGPWVSLPDPPLFSVPATGQTSINVPWPVPASVKIGDTEVEHFCVRVEIDRYRDPAHPDQEEIVVFDNWAQSNFDNASVSFGSPSERIVTAATATNALARTATYLFGVDQSSDWYRIYLGHAWLRLPSGETGGIELGYESLSGDPVFGPEFERNLESITSRDHHAAVTSSILPESTECGAPRDLFGVRLALRAGRRAWIEDVRRDGELVQGRVRSSSDANVFDVTFGEFHLATWPDDEPERVSHTQGVIANGVGRVLLSNEALRDLADGRPTWFSVARPADVSFARAVTAPAHFR